MKRASLFATVVALFGGACLAQSGAVPVELKHTPDGYVLERAGEPYFVNGVGGSGHLETLAACGGNSIRTWGQGQIDDDDGALLDRANDLGLTVCVGFWMAHQRHGFDYTDAEAVRRQHEEALAFVRRWKDHPAVLVWCVGNEAENGDQARLVLSEINSIAREIKKIDPSHPVMTAFSGVWPEKGAMFKELCPDVDILGVNVYGGAVVVPKDLTEQGYTGPYVLTEFGPVGHWECAKTDWGAPIEQTSTEKAHTYEEFYDVAVLDEPARALGAYAFLWGQKQERTESWYGMFLKSGEKTEPVDVMSRLWGGTVENHAPTITPIDSKAALTRAAPGVEFDASVEAEDPDGDALTYRWVVKRESSDRQGGGDREAEPEEVPGLVLTDPGPSIRFRTPDEPGPYRLFVFVYDGKDAAATANTPFYVE